MSRYAILNEEGQAVEEGRFRNSVGSIAKYFGKRCRKGGFGSGYQVGLDRAPVARLGHEVIVANARELKWISLCRNASARILSQRTHQARLLAGTPGRIAPYFGIGLAIRHGTYCTRNSLSSRDGMKPRAAMILSTVEGSSLPSMSIRSWRAYIVSGLRSLCMGPSNGHELAIARVVGLFIRQCR